MPSLPLVKRLVLIVTVCIAAAGLTVGAFYLFIIGHFHVPPPKADYPRPRSLLEAQKQDLNYFSKLMALDRSYAPQARALAEQRLAGLQSLDHPLQPAIFKVALMQIIALADNGHSAVGTSSSNPGIAAAPIRVTPFADGFYVMRARQPYGALLGGRITAIDGVPFDTVLQKLETLQGGTKGWRRGNAASLIVQQDILYGLGIARNADTSSWTVRRPDGHFVTALLRASPLPGPETPNWRWLSPEPLAGMGRDWLSYAPLSGHLPESLGHYDDNFALIDVPNSCAVDIRLHYITNANGQKILPFIKAAESALKAHPPCAAIVDLRGNHGGDYDNTRRFAYLLPDLLAGNGPIYVLTDSQTFSAAIVTTAFLKDAGRERTKIVGEPVGDRLAFYSEGPGGCLPNSKLCVRYQIAKHDLTRLCLQRDCWWRDWFSPVRVTSLQPDQLVPHRFADWNTGRDAAYEEAVSAIQQTKPR